jgi:anti-anti-sigma factor
MLIKCDEAQDSVVCHLVGDLDHLAIGQFYEAVAQLSRNQHVIFDVSGVPCVDAAGLVALMHTVKRTRGTGGEAVVCEATPAVKRWLEIIAIPRTVNMFDSVTAARSYFRDNSDEVIAGRRAA